MEVLILGSPGTRELKLPEVLTDRGFEPRYGKNSELERRFAEDLAGVVFFDDGSRETLSLLIRCRRKNREHKAPLVVVAPGYAREYHAKLRAGGASLVCDPDVSNERLAAEIESRRDMFKIDGQAVRQEMLQPFTAAAMEAAQVMANSSLRATKIDRKKDYGMFGDVSALIYLIGKIERVLAVSFPLETARELTERILGGIAGDVGEEMIFDCVGEFLNIIAGQVMGTFSATPFEFDISTPTLVSGPRHEIRHSRDLPCYVVNLEGDFGALTMQLCIRAQEGE